MWWCGTPSERDGPTAGFTLIEALIALAVVSVALTAIGGLIASSVRSTRWLDQHVALVETARGIATGLPDRNQLRPGNLSGEIAAYHWQIDVTPFLANFVDPRLPTPWVPQTVVVRVRAPSGSILELQTVRLRGREGG